MEGILKQWISRYSYGKRKKKNSSYKISQEKNNIQQINAFI